MDHETSLRPSSQAQALLQNRSLALSPALLPIRPLPSFIACLSVFDPNARPYSLGPMTVECEHCSALYFIQEVVGPSFVFIFNHIIAAQQHISVNIL